MKTKQTKQKTVPHLLFIRDKKYKKFIEINLKRNTEAVTGRSSVKKLLLKMLQNSKENICAGVSYLIQLQTWGSIQKETPAQVFYCEFCEFFKNTYLVEHLRTAASRNGCAIHFFLYKQLVYKQLALSLKIAKQLWGLNHLAISNNIKLQITEKITDYVLTYIAELKPQSKAKVCYSVGISLNNPKN